MNKNFWIERVEKYGHTGWSDQLTYLYDQKQRVKLVKDLTKKIFKDGIENCLDYGCGSGEIANVLSKQVKNRCIGVDIAEEIISIAQKKFHQSNIEFNTLDNEKYKTIKYDLIVSITVLQHILDEAELIKVLQLFYQLINDNGIIIIVDSYNLNNTSEYMKLRDYQQFIDTLYEQGFEVIEKYNLQHPSIYPTKLYTTYRKNLLIRVLNKLSFSRVLSKIANFLIRFDNPLTIYDSPVKLTILRKKNDHSSYRK